MTTNNDARTELLAAQIIQQITRHAHTLAVEAGEHPSEIARLKQANDGAVKDARRKKKEVVEQRDREALEQLDIPNHGAGIDTAPEIHSVLSVEHCSKCGKHKYPSCGPTVFASLLNEDIDTVMEWMEQLNGKPLKRDRHHTAIVTDELIESACADVGLETEVTHLAKAPRFQDMLNAVLRNTGDSATYIVFVPRHVLLLRTDGRGNFCLVDSGFMFSREVRTQADPLQVRTRKRVHKLMRVFND